MSARSRLVTLLGLLTVGFGALSANPTATHPQARGPEVAPHPHLPRPTLPPGAVQVLGDWRLRGVGRVFAISPDGERVAGAGMVWSLKTGRLLTRFGTGDGHFYAVRFTPDGSTVVALGYFPNEFGKAVTDIRRFDSATGEPIGPPAVPKLNRDEYPQAISPDGTAAFTGGPHVARLDTARGKRLWDVAIEQPKGTAPDRPFRADPVVASPDGKLVAACVWQRAPGTPPWQPPYTNGYVLVLDAVTGKEVSRLTRPASVLSAFTPDGTGLLVETVTGLAIIDAKTGEAKKEFPAARPAAPVAFSPDGRWIAASPHADIDVYDAATGKRVSSVPGDPNHTSWASSVAFTPDGKALAVPRSGLALYDSATGNLLPHSPDPPDLDVFGRLVFSPDGRTLTAFNDWQPNYTLKWDVASGEELARRPPPKLGPWDQHARELLSAGRFTATQTLGVVRVVGPDGREVGKFEIEVGRKEGDETPGNPWAPPPNHKHLADVSRDGRFAFVTDNETVERWDVATGKRLDVLADFSKLPRTWPMHPHSWPPPARPAVWPSPCGRFVVVFPQLSAWRQIPMQVFEVAGGKRLTGWDTSARAGEVFLDWSADGGRLATLLFEERGADGWQAAGIVVRESSTGRVVARSEFAEPARNVTVSADLRSFSAQTGPWTSNVTESVVLFEVATGRVRHTFPAGEYWRGTAAFSPDSRLLATAHVSKPVVLWDVRGERPADPPDAAALARAWDALAGDDAPAAFAAVRLLAAFPDQALPFLESKAVTQAPDPDRLREMIRQLDTAGLVAAVREEVRAIRAVEAVEWVATPAAVKLLERWAAGPAGARLADESKAALDRLRGK